MAYVIYDFNLIVQKIKHKILLNFKIFLSVSANQTIVSLDSAIVTCQNYGSWNAQPKCRPCGNGQIYTWGKYQYQEPCGTFTWSAASTHCPSTYGAAWSLPVFLNLSDFDAFQSGWAQIHNDSVWLNSNNADVNYNFDWGSSPITVNPPPFAAFLNNKQFGTVYGCVNAFSVQSAPNAARAWFTFDCNFIFNIFCQGPG